MIIIYLPQSLTYLNTRDIHINNFLEIEYPSPDNNKFRIRISKNSEEYFPLISWLSIKNELGNIKLNIEPNLSMFLNDCSIFNFDETIEWVEFIFSIKWIS